MGDFVYKDHNDYASKGVAGSGLGLGIAGTALGLLNNSGNGLLGGLFGNNNGSLWQAQNTALTGQVAELKARLDSQHEITTAYEQTVHDNRQLRNEMYAFIKPLSDEAANNRVEIAKLQAELKCCCEKQELREQIILGKVNEVALTTKNGLDSLTCALNSTNNSLNQLAATVDSITKTIVPASAICPEVMPRFNSYVAPAATPAAPVTLTN